MRMHSFLRWANNRQEEIISLIQEMVNCESPSDSPIDVNRFVDLMVERTSDIATAEVLGTDGAGKHLRLTFRTGSNAQGQILGLGHSDTVWPLGTLRSMPFRRANGKLWGPGVLDMKSGLAFFIYAARLLRELDVQTRKRVVLLVVSDE